MPGGSKTPGDTSTKGAYWRRGSGDDGGDRRRGHGAVGHPRQDAERARAIELLGGASRESVTVYGHANGATLDETVASVG